MDAEKFQQAEQHMKTIRDERQLHANTATRVGAALLELLYLMQDLGIDDLDIESGSIQKFVNTPVFEQGIRVFVSALFGNYEPGSRGAMIDENGNSEFETITVRSWAKISRFVNSPTFQEGLTATKLIAAIGGIVIGEYVAETSGAKIDAQGNAELESLIVRNWATITKFLNKPNFTQGLLTLGSIILGEYAQGLKGGIITEDAFAELKELWTREHAKIGDGARHIDTSGNYVPALEVLGDSTFTNNLSSPDFISAFLGGLGWAIQRKEVENASGETEVKYTLEIDNVTVRGALRVFEMIISQLLGENGNRFFSDMMEVDHYDASTGKIWMDTRNGQLYNPFRVGDIIMVQQYNGNPSAANNWYVTKSYELRVTAVGLGSESGEKRLDWLMFENFMASDDALTPETAIKKGDTLVRVDSDTDPNRKGLITMMTVGDNTPYMDVIYGLKTDQKNAMKGRLGKLDGIMTDVFGALEGFGVYLNNLYGVGKFFNAQTGESLNARIAATQAEMHNIYSETTYNIPEDENFIKNGFFQKDLDNWNKCEVDGSTAAEEGSNEMLGVGGKPLMINGNTVNARSKVTAEVKEYDGIRMLHLRSMGVSQNFSLLTPNGTHQVVNSNSDSDTTTKDVPDTLYMGIRILPVTDGMLSVKFLKSDGTWRGFQRNITCNNNWMLIQEEDSTEYPWTYTDEGKLVISYTGECFIRFVALQTDPIANSRTDYNTKIVQTSRKIMLQASRISANEEAIAILQVTAEGILTEAKSYTDGRLSNYSTTEQTAAMIASGVASANADAQGYVAALKALINTDVLTDSGNAYATWKVQTSATLATLAGKWDANGNLIGYSTTEQTATAISQAVVGLASGSDLDTLNTTLRGLIATAQSTANGAASSAASSATWIEQNSTMFTTIAAQFNADGSLKNYSTTEQTATAISQAVVGLASGSDLDTLNTTLRGLIATAQSTANGAASSAASSATWIEQNSTMFTTIAAQFNADGSLKNYSTTEQTATAISQAVVGLASGSDLDTLNTTLRGLITTAQSTANGAASSAASSATWIEQNSTMFTTIAAQFNDDGSLKNYSTTEQTATAISQAVVGLASGSDLDTLDANLRGLISTAQSIAIGAASTASFSATWIEQNSTMFTTIAAQFNSDGSLKNYSTTEQTATAISQAVVGLASGSDLDTLNTTLRGLIATAQSTANGAASSAASSATWIGANSGTIATIAAQFNANGTLKYYSTTEQTATAISQAVYGLEYQMSSIKQTADSIKLGVMDGWQNYITNPVSTDADPGSCKTYKPTADTQAFLKTYYADAKGTPLDSQPPYGSDISESGYYEIDNRKAYSIVNDETFGKVYHIANTTGGDWQLLHKLESRYANLTGATVTWFCVVRSMNTNNDHDGGVMNFGSGFENSNSGQQHVAIRMTAVNGVITVSTGLKNPEDQTYYNNISYGQTALGNNWYLCWCTAKLAAGRTIIAGQEYSSYNVGYNLTQGTWRIYYSGIVLGSGCPSIEMIKLGANLKKTGIDINKGIITLDAEKTVVTGNLQARGIDTQEIGGRRIRIESGTMNVYNDKGQVGLSIGWDENGDPYLTVAKVDSDGTIIAAYRLTYDSIGSITASFTNDKFASLQLNDAGVSATILHNNTNVRTYYRYTAAKNTVTGTYSNMDASGSSSSDYWKNARAKYNGKYFTTNNLSNVLSNGNAFVIADGYYISKTQAPVTTDAAAGVYARVIYDFLDGIGSQVGVVYYKASGSGYVYCDADGRNETSSFDPERYIYKL